MNRRNFLQAMLAAAAAPAICRAENLMKIYVPPQKIYSGTPADFLGFMDEFREVPEPLYDLGLNDFTVDGWVQGKEGFRFISIVQSVENGVKSQVEMIDGTKVAAGTLDRLGYYKAGYHDMTMQFELDQTTVNIDYNFLMNSFDPCFTKAARSEENIRQRAKAFSSLLPKDWM